MTTTPNRRRFMAQAASSFLGVSAVNFFPVARAAGEGASSLKLANPTAKRVIYLYMSGGMSHLDTFDPKTDRDVMGETKLARTEVDEVSLTNHLPLLQNHADKLAVIRSMNSTQGAHQQGNYFMHTSYAMRSSIRHPSLGPWRAKLLGEPHPTLPASVLIGGSSRHPGSGFFESRLTPLPIRKPQDGLKNSKLRIPEKEFAMQRKLAAALDAPFLERYDQKNVRAYNDMYEDAVKLMNSEDLAAFDLKQEDEQTRKSYGDSNFGQGCLLARRLAESGVSFIEVDLGGWDTHSSNFIRVPEQTVMLDQAYSALLADLEARDMLKDTLVVLATEFGRTPNINVNDGRDHHPQAFSCVLAGGGVKGGQTHGVTDETGSKVLEGAVTCPDLNATIGYALGIPLDQIVYSSTLRPFTVADKGQPLAHLFA